MAGVPEEGVKKKNNIKCFGKEQETSYRVMVLL